MAQFNHQPTITLEVHRCLTCGRYWAIESSVSGRCPRCAQATVTAALEEQMHLERTVRSLRGAVTAAKRRSGRR